MKNILLFSSLLISVFILSCTSTSNDNANQISKSNYTLQIIDSFIIQEPFIFFDDYYNDKYVFHNHSSNDVVIYNLKTDLTTKFNNFGTNYDNYNNLWQNISFLNDTTICIGQIKKIKLYNTTGKYIKEIKYESKEPTYATLKHLKKLNDSIVIIHDPLQGDNSKPEFYQQEHKLYAKWNINNNTKTLFMDFPPVNSIYHDKTYFFENPFTYYSKIYNNLFYTISANEPAIYVFDINTLNFNKRIKLDLDYYKSVRFKFGDELKYEEKMLNLFLSSTIDNIFVFDNYLFVLYMQPYTKEFIMEYRNTLDGMIFDDPPFRKTCLHIIEDGKKSSIDINIPEKLGTLIYTHSSDNLVFQKAPNNIDEIKAQTTFYIVKLMENENK